MDCGGDAVSDSFRRIDLDEFFHEARELRYVLIKRERFPSYTRGGDLDILCTAVKEFADRVLGAANRYVEQGYEIEVTTKPTAPHIYVDFYRNDELEIRFDLVEG